MPIDTSGPTSTNNITSIVEIVGYAARTFSASQTPNWTTGPYIVQTILLLVAPALFAASIYMILGRIILMTGGETHAIVKRRWLTKLFVLGDVVSFTVQAGGKFCCPQNTNQRKASLTVSSSQVVE